MTTENTMEQTSDMTSNTIIDVSQYIEPGETVPLDHIHNVARLFDGVTNLCHPVEYITTAAKTAINLTETDVTLTGDENAPPVNNDDQYIDDNLMMTSDETDFDLDGADLDKNVTESLDNYNEAKGVFLSEPKRGPNGQFLSRAAKEKLWENMSAQTGQEMVSDTI